MKKGHLRSLMMGGIITFLMMSFLIILIYQEVEERQEKEVRAAYEVGIKIADAKWLYREGMLTSEELKEINEATRHLAYEELEERLIEILRGKEEEYLAERVAEQQPVAEQ